MDNFTRQVFLIEIEKQCGFALYAAEGMQKSINNFDTVTFWFYSESLLTSTANIAKLLWGSGSEKDQSEKLKKDRRELRNYIGIKDEKLRKRKIRNSFEHFDEKMDKWAQSAKDRNFIDSNIGPADMIVGVGPKDHLRFFNTDTIAITFKGYSFEVPEILKAVTELKELVDDKLEESKKENN